MTVGFHYISMIDLIINHVIKFQSLTCLPLLGGWAYLQSQIRSPLATWLVFPAWLSPSLSLIVVSCHCCVIFPTKLDAERKKKQKTNDVKAPDFIFTGPVEVFR